jgi:hypothetical protein
MEVTNRPIRINRNQYLLRRRMNRRSPSIINEIKLIHLALRKSLISIYLKQVVGVCIVPVALKKHLKIII